MVGAMMDRQTLVARITADLLSPDKPRDTNVTPCVTCGRPTLIQGGDPDNTFCRAQCERALEAGLVPRYADLPMINGVYSRSWSVVAGTAPGYMPQPMRMSKDGFLIACANCRREFDSRGWRCCSTECERSFKAKERNMAIIGQSDMDPPTKRKCEQCSRDIPNWRDGRRVRQDSQFCSKACAQKNRRKNGVGEADISEM